MKTVVTEIFEYFEEVGLMIHENTKKFYLETEKQQFIDFANKCQIVIDSDIDGNITFVDPKGFFESTYSTKKL